jgi:hypothetical protein
MATWFQRWVGRIRTSYRCRKTHLPYRKRTSLWLETLEDRVLLSIASPPTQLLPTGQQPIAVQLGLIDTDSLQGAAILGSGGSLTTALNDGANGWRNVQTQNLGTGAVNGMVLGGFDSANPFDDVAVQGPNAISVFHGDGAGHFTLAQTLTPVSAGNLPPTGGGDAR